MIEVTDDGDAGRIVAERYLAGRQRVAVTSPQHRQQNFAAQVSIARVPIYVEIFAVTAVLSACQHIHPPGIAAADRHVVGNDVKEQPHRMPAKLTDEST